VTAVGPAAGAPESSKLKISSRRGEAHCPASLLDSSSPLAWSSFSQRGWMGRPGLKYGEAVARSPAIVLNGAARALRRREASSLLRAGAGAPGSRYTTGVSKPRGRGSDETPFSERTRSATSFGLSTVGHAACPTALWHAVDTSRCLPANRRGNILTRCAPTS